MIVPGLIKYLPHVLPTHTRTDGTIARNVQAGGDGPRQGLPAPVADGRGADRRRRSGKQPAGVGQLSLWSDLREGKYAGRWKSRFH